MCPLGIFVLPKPSLVSFNVALQFIWIGVPDKQEIAGPYAIRIYQAFYLARISGYHRIIIPASNFSIQA